VLNPHLRLLEVGAGSGHALLDLQAQFPFCQCYGVNYVGYPFPQAGSSSEDLLQTAKTFSVPVWCKSNGTPVLPNVTLIPSLADDNFSLGNFESRFFDAIISIHALNNKLPWEMSNTYIPKLVRLLAPGGTFGCSYR